MKYPSLHRTGCSVIELDVLRAVAAGDHFLEELREVVDISRASLYHYVWQLNGKGLAVGNLRKGVQLTPRCQAIVDDMRELWKGTEPCTSG